MVKNSKALLYGILSLLIILSACNAETGEKSTDTEVNEDSISKEVEQETELKEEIVIPDISLAETRSMVNQYFEDLTNIYINAGEKFNLADQPLTEEIYQSMEKEFKPYATDHLIETQLYEIAQNFCYAGCDASYFPASSTLGLRYKMTDNQNGKIRLHYVLPEDELEGSVKECIMRE